MPYLPKGTVTPPMEACTDCGAFVWHIGLHDEWHFRNQMREDLDD